MPMKGAMPKTKKKENLLKKLPMKACRSLKKEKKKSKKR